MTAPNVLARLRRLEAVAGTGSAEGARRADDRARILEKLARLAAVAEPDHEAADPARFADLRKCLLALQGLRDAAGPEGVETGPILR
jgi:hypothetical protein